MSISTPPIHNFVDWNCKDWCLYDMPGSKEAGEALTLAFNTAMRDLYLAMAQGTPVHKAGHAMRDCMFDSFQSFEDFGASDTEPRERLDGKMEKILGEGWPVIPNGYVDSIVPSADFVRHDADGWDILSRKVGAESVAQLLNTTLNEALVKAFVLMARGEPLYLAAREVRLTMEKTMDGIDGFGASDTEPRTILWREMNLVLGDGCEDAPRAAKRPGFH